MHVPKQQPPVNQHERYMLTFHLKITRLQHQHESTTWRNQSNIKAQAILRVDFSDSTRRGHEATLIQKLCTEIRLKDWEKIISFSVALLVVSCGWGMLALGGGGFSRGAQRMGVWLGGLYEKGSKSIEGRQGVLGRRGQIYKVKNLPSHGKLFSSKLFRWIRYLETSNA